MNDIVIGCRKYISEVLTKRVELADYIDESTILFNSYENDGVWDLLVLLDDELFESKFAHLHGEHFVVDDHAHKPVVFTRIKSYRWLRRDFAKRLPIALWIFQNVTVIQERKGLFRQIISEQEELFRQKLVTIIKRKYLELRSDRHNLRYSVLRSGDMANVLLKANIVKLSLELSLLADSKPYPFRILLPNYAKNNATNGNETSLLLNEFLTTINPERTISLSNELIKHVADTLNSTGLHLEDFLSKWWLYLD